MQRIALIAICDDRTMKGQGGTKVVKLAVYAVGLMLLMAACSVVASAGNSSWRPVKLAEERSGNYLWAASLSRSGSKHGGQRPCVGIALRNLKPGVPAEQNFESFEQSCSSLALDVGPNFVLSSEGKGTAQFTVGAFAVTPRIETVRVDLGAAGSRTLKAKLLSPRQQKNAGVRSARYATFKIRGSFCLGEVIGYDGLGAVVYERPSEGCAGDSTEGAREHSA